MGARIRLEDDWLVVECIEGCEDVEAVLLEYTVGPLSFDEREPEGHERRVVERIRVEGIRGSLRIRLRGVERLEKVCLVARSGLTRCYRV